MNLAEVRLGNYFQWTDNGQELEVTPQMLVKHEFWDHIRSGDIRPLSLTSDKLIELGYGRQGVCYVRGSQMSLVQEAPDQFYLEYQLHNIKLSGMIFKRRISYVHHLQNLHFDLTSELLKSNQCQRKQT